MSPYGMEVKFKDWNEPTAPMKNAPTPTPTIREAKWMAITHNQNHNNTSQGSMSNPHGPVSQL